MCHEKRLTKVAKIVSEADRRSMYGYLLVNLDAVQKNQFCPVMSSMPYLLISIPTVTTPCPCPNLIIPYMYVASPSRNIEHASSMPRRHNRNTQDDLYLCQNTRQPHFRTTHTQPLTLSHTPIQALKKLLYSTMSRADLTQALSFLK